MYDLWLAHVLVKALVAYRKDEEVTSNSKVSVHLWC